MASPDLLPVTTALGPVRLVVADLGGAAEFYERVVGLRRQAHDGDLVQLGAGAGGPPLVELLHRADAPPRAQRSSGLFHLAVLVPTRAALAESLRRVAVGGWRLDGASDHLVSEALYLSDPEGNGIEIYRDRPREQWRTQDGELAMATLPLDLEQLVADLPPATEPDTGVPAATRIGHVHLQVADLAAAESFYVGALGFEPIVRSYPGALFVAAGGYHHHVGLNTWSSAGGPPAAAGVRGLAHFTVVLPDAAAREHAAQRIAAADFPLREGADDDLIATDPFGIDVLLSVSP
jgi:catechol 2,3-dioxygenase